MEDNINESNVPQGEEIAKYSKDYSEPKFWDKIVAVAKKAGVKVVYAALLLYYVLMSDNTSKGDKAKILGALGYFILPFDLIPDWIPVAGFTDDLAALTWAIYSVAKNITPEIKEQAKAKLGDIFKNYDPADLEGLL